MEHIFHYNITTIGWFFENSFYRPAVFLSLSPDRPAATKITTNVLDISGLTALQESPRRVTAARRHAQKRPPAIGDFITVTDSMGNRVYLNKKEDEEKVSDLTKYFTRLLAGEQCVKFIDFSCAFSQAPDPRAFRNSLNGLGLLAVPIEVLKEQIAERVRICEHADKPKWMIWGKSVWNGFVFSAPSTSGGGITKIDRTYE